MEEIINKELTPQLIEDISWPEISQITIGDTIFFSNGMVLKCKNGKWLRTDKTLRQLIKPYLHGRNKRLGR